MPAGHERPPICCVVCFVVSRCHAWPCLPAYVINLLWNPVLLRGFGGVCGRCTSPKAGLRVIQPRFTLHRLCKHEGAAEKCSVFAQLKRPFCAANESALATVLLVLQVLARGISVRPGRPADPGSFAFSPRDNSELVHLPPRRLQFSLNDVCVICILYMIYRAVSVVPHPKPV